MAKKQRPYNKEPKGKGPPAPVPGSNRTIRRERVEACLKGTEVSGWPVVKTTMSEVKAIAKKLGIQIPAEPPPGVELFVPKPRVSRQEQQQTKPASTSLEALKATLKAKEAENRQREVEEKLAECQERNKEQALALQQLVEQQVALNETLEQKLLKRQSAQEDECIICRNKKPDTVIFPCRHQHVCSLCLHDLIRRHNSRAAACPSCRTPIGFFSTVYRL